MQSFARLDPHVRDVHLWIVRLQTSEESLARASSWLSPDEIARAKRFHFDHHRRAFILGRAVLRALLSGYLGMAPADVRFAYGPQGKPALADTSSSLRFNMTNSGNLAAYAFTHGCEIGVDIEQHRAVSDLENIAQLYFSREEACELLALPEPERIAAFFNCWTRKEAFIKAMGGGLSIPLESFRVTLRPGDAARLVSVGESVEDARAWMLHEFRPGSGYVGAIAYRDSSRLVLERSDLSIDDLTN